jgi:hypothetical protein
VFTQKNEDKTTENHINRFTGPDGGVCGCTDGDSQFIQYRFD